MLEPAAAHDFTIRGDLRHVGGREGLGGADGDGAGVRVVGELEGEAFRTVMLESIESGLMIG